MGLGVRQYCAAVLTSRGLRREKPSAEAFAAACAALGLAPAAVLHVGDHATRDYAGARAAGLQARLLCRHSASAAAVAAPGDVVASLLELPALVAGPGQ